MILRPSASEIDRFLNDYTFESNALIESIEVPDEHGEYSFMMFAVFQPIRDEVSLLVWWPLNSNGPMSDMT